MINFIDETGKQHSAIVECKKTKGVNGEKSLTGTIYTNDEILEGIGRGWRLQFEDENYCLTYANPIDEGTRIVVEFDAVHEFFFDLSKSVVYAELNGSNTATAYLDFIFNGSGYDYHLEVSIPAFEKESFGMKNRLDLFKDFVSSTGVEFSVNGKIVRILEKVGSNLSTIVKKGFNLSELRIEKNIGNFITYLKGYGAYNDPEDQTKGRLEVEYLSPLASIYGKLEGDPIVDERYKNATSLTTRLKNDIESSYGISVDIDMEDLTKAGYEYDQPHEGDYIMAINKDLGFEQKIRIMSYTTSYDTEGNIIDHDVSCGSDNLVSQSTKSDNDFRKNVQAGLENAVNTANQAWISADGKNKVFTGTDEPVATNKGDIWYQVDGEKTIMKFWNGYEWQEFIDPKAVQQAAAEAKQAGEEAKQAGEEAKLAGADAKQAADEAKALGEEAKQAGEEAKVLGNEALVAGQNALEKATTADSNANTALTNANSAVDQATQASQKADNSTTVANEATTQAANAVTNANTALANANKAIQDVGNLGENVESLNTLATTAENNANTALTNARNAINQVTQLNSDLEDTNGQVSTLTDNLNGFKQTVYTKTQTDTKIATVQSDINGFKTSVSNTYATKSEIQGIKAGVRNYICEVAWTTPGGLDANGETVANDGRRISGYISINANTDYFVQVFEVATLYNLQVAFYDTNRQFISLITATNASATGKTPTNAASMRISTPYRAQYGGRYKFEFGTVGTDWTQAPEDTQFIYTNLQTQVDQTANAVSSKADKTIVDQISGRVDTAEGSITTMAGQINLKANKSTVDTIINRVSATEASLSLQDGKIATLTTKTNGLDTSLSSLTQDFNGFQADVYTKSQTDTKVSTVQQSVDQFKTTVSNTYSTKTETQAVKSSVDSIGTNIAYAWSPDGKDRFRRVFRENLAKGQSKVNSVGVFDSKYFIEKNGASGSIWETFSNFMPSYTTKNAWSAYCIRKECLGEVTIGDEFYFSASVYNDGDTNINMTYFCKGTDKSGTSFTVVPKQWTKLEIVTKITDLSELSDGIRFEPTTAVSAGVYVSDIVLKKDDKDKTVRLPSDADYDNAIPRYIGRSLKDSNNPADFTWEPNPERKPWTSYASGLNGEGLSLMPYGENKLVGTSNTIKTAMTVNYEVLYGFSTVKNFLGKRITLQAYIENAAYDARVQLWTDQGAGLYGSIVPKGTSGISYVTGRVSYTATDGNISVSFSGQGTISTPAKLPYSSLKLELVNTMGMPTPWTPAPSDPNVTLLDYTPKYVGTAVLPYDDWTKYDWRLSSDWNDVKASTSIDQNANKIALKADQTTVNKLTGRVDTAEGNITTMAGQINLKANQTDVDTVKGRVSATESSLTLQDGKITALTSKTDGHTTQIGNLQTSYNGLSSTVAQVQTDLNGKATTTQFSSLSQTVSNLQGTVQDKADKSQVTQMAGQITSVVTSFNNLDLSDSNLLSNSDFRNGINDWVADGTSISYVDGSLRAVFNGTGFNRIYYANVLSGMARGEAYSVTIEAYSNSSASVSVGGWGNMSAAKTVTPNNANFAEYRFDNLVRGDALALSITSSTPGAILRISRIMIVKGIKARPWALAPSDLATKSQITQLSDRMNFRITNSDGSVTQIDLANKVISLSGEQVNITGNTYIANGVIKTAAIADLAVSNAKIANLAVNEGKIASLAVTNAKIADLAVNEAKIADLAVSTAKIGSLAVSEGKIADLAVTNAKIANLAVSTAKIADLAVTNAKIGNISADKINVGTLNGGNVNIINLNASNITSGTITGIDIKASTFYGTSSEGSMQLNGTDLRFNTSTNSFKINYSGITNINNDFGTRNIRFVEEGIAITAGSENQGIRKNSGYFAYGRETYLWLLADGNQFQILNNPDWTYFNTNKPLYINSTQYTSIYSDLLLNGKELKGASNVVTSSGVDSWKVTTLEIKDFSTASPYLQVASGTRVFGVSMWSSDRNLKKNISTQNDSALSVVDQLKIKQFDWKEGGKHVDFGLIAQEVETLLPDAVFSVTQPNGEQRRQLKSEAFVPLLLKSIQELKQEIEVLKAKVA